jgi:hypothetical protein
MKTFQLIFFCFVCFNKSYCQKITKSYCRIVVEITKEKKSKKTLPKVDIKSTFSVEDSSMIQLLEKNIINAIQVGKQVKKGKYICSVTFIITKDAYVSDVRCEIDSGFGICEEVVRQIKKAPRWRPAEPIEVKIIE